MINGVVLGKLRNLDDVGVLTDIVNHHLEDFAAFRDEIIAYVEKSNEQTDEEPNAPAEADTQE